jgi:HlyD family secretion protein
MKKILLLALVIVALAGLGYWYWQTQAAGQTTFRLAEVKRGRLVATVGSTGTLQPREIVDIGAQVAGRIVSIGKDSNTQSGIVDWGSVVEGPVVDDLGASTVGLLGLPMAPAPLVVAVSALVPGRSFFAKKGTVLAQIDPDLYEAQLKSATAAVKSARADLLVKKAMVEQANADWDRAETLYKQVPRGIAQAEYDLYRATMLSTNAQVGVSEANIDVTLANLKTAQTNLNYATITSPVNGVVIDRRVNVGQTVVASLSAPSLFLIAKDLSKMEVWATVNEVDVNRIYVGQKVKFTVDALAGRLYYGQVVPQGKLPFRLNAAMTQNVVTYTVVVSADNTDGLLRPYLTTNLSFIVADKKNALLVPNAALRWQPSRQQIAPDLRDTYFALRGKKPSATDVDTQAQGFVWVKGENGFVRYIQLHVGLSDTVNTEVLGVLGGGELAENTQVIVAEVRTEAQGNSANPFVATPFGPNKKKD